MNTPNNEDYEQWRLRIGICQGQVEYGSSSSVSYLMDKYLSRTRIYIYWVSVMRVST